LNLTVDESTFEKIKEKKRGAALKMLYQIKLKTEKSLFTSPKKQSIKESQIFSKKSSIGHISNEASLKFDAKMHTTQMLKSKLRPFEDEKRTQEQTIKQKHLEMTNLHHSVAMTKRAAEMDKQMNNKQFMKEWHHKGMKDWRKNQDDKLLRLEKARLLKERFDDIKNTKTQKIRNDATEEMQGGIEGFQRNLEKLGIDINVIPDENKDKKKKPKSFAETFSSVATMNKIRERKVAGDFARKEKERRTNKLMVDQARSQNEIMWRMEETKRLEELRQLGNTKREKAYEKWRIKQCKKIEQQKRTRKNDKFESRRGKELEIELEKNKKDFEEVSIELKQEYSENRKLCYEQEQRKRKEKREEHTEDMEEVLLDILEIANKAMKAQKESTTHQIPPHLFKSWINMLKRGEPLTFKSARSMALTKTQTRLTTMKDTIADEGDQLDKLQLTDYLLHLAFYKPQFILNAAQYAVSLISNFNQIDAFSLSVRGGNFPQIEDNCDIGDVLKRIVYAIYKVPDTKLGGELGVCVPNFAHLPLKFAMIGRDGAGKSVLAQFLSEKYGVKVFRVEKMVKDVLELVRPKEEVEEEVKKGKIPVKKQPKKLAKGEVEEKKLDLLDSEEIRSVGEEIASCVSDGDEILDILYVRLFIANLNATFSPKDRTAKKAEMKTAILREKEINEEIEKLQDDLNNKAKQKVAAKRQTDLQAELETLKKPLEPGWLLVDFPKTLKQAQLLEECLSGYSTDLSAAEIARNNKVASNELIIPSSPQKENTDLQKSGLDCVVCINTSKPVCKSRQLEKNEELLRKSQEIEKEKEKINTISEEDLLEKHIEWDKNAEALMRWFNKFGFAEQNFPLCQFVENNESAEETQNKLSEIAEGILAMHKKEDEETLNEIMKELEGGDNEPTEIETEKATEEEGEKKIKDSIEGREEEGEEHKTEECGQEKPSEHEELLNQWNDFQEDYIAALKDLFKGDRRQKDLIVNGLIDIQKQFYSFLERNADEKQVCLSLFLFLLLK
jgi:adenylate kinase family enzyme